ncbi:MAG TPA: hypothetical protein VFM09_07520 [Marmoricola sp.]|nr:hypothetical protein [Marmoricola sp.]
MTNDRSGESMLNNDLGETLLVILSVLGALAALPFVLAWMEASLPNPPRPVSPRLAPTVPVPGEEPLE